MHSLLQAVKHKIQDRKGLKEVAIFSVSIAVLSNNSVVMAMLYLYILQLQLKNLFLNFN